MPTDERFIDTSSEKEIKDEIVCFVSGKAENLSDKKLASPKSKEELHCESSEKVFREADV